MSQSLQELNFALANKIPLGSEKLSLDTSHGPLTLEGDLGRKAVKAIRLVMVQEAKKQGGAK